MSYTQYCNQKTNRDGSLRKDACPNEATIMRDGQYYCDTHVPLEDGQRLLLNDLKDLCNEVRGGEFGDFSNEKYAAPKVELVNKLEALIFKVKDGEYD